MAEERISGVESVLAEIADKMGRKLDEHSRSLVFHGQQLTEISKKLDDQDIALYDQRAILAAHSRDIRDIRAELRTVNGKLDTVIDLLTRKPGE
jgi:hypothetical protein